MDILTGNGRSIARNDFSSDWDNSPKLGKVKAGDDFLLNGSLGETNRRGVWDSSDRIKFSLLEVSTLNLNLDPQTIAEVVQFDSAGNASVIGSIEYGSTLQLQLAAGRYGLSLFVEGDRIDYSIAGQFL
ncbi:hypothetical protein Q5692_31710 [Microcoleus sp. C2C3]|uniref:hypothetical protein n=1 Tax=unclassified Microcoleus TaxID=2642155 RepID=UPI002FD5F121